MSITEADNEKFKLTIISNDEKELSDYLKAKDMKAFIWEFAENLRTYSKHGLPEHITTIEDAIDFIKDDFYQLKYDYIENSRDF